MYMNHNFNLPIAIDIEEAVLGSVLLETRAMPMALKHLRAEMFHRESHQLIFATLERMFGDKPVQIRTSGATHPAAAPLMKAFGFPVLSLGIANFDNNQHGENENLQLGYLFAGIRSIAAVLSM